MPWYRRAVIPSLLLFLRYAESLSNKPSIRKRVGVYGWFLLLILVRRASLLPCQTLARRYHWVEATNLDFFHFIADYSFLWLSLSARIYFPGLFLASPLSPLRFLVSFPLFLLFSLSPVLFKLFRSLPPYPCLSCIVHRASQPPDLDSYANCGREHGAVVERVRD